jgi:hypothetical protein
MENSHIDDLQNLRDAHVAERRRLIRQAIETAEVNKSPVGVNWGRDVMHLQEQIEAIDRAIEDERRLKLNPRAFA